MATITVVIGQIYYYCLGYTEAQYAILNFENDNLSNENVSNLHIQNDDFCKLIHSFVVLCWKKKNYMKWPNLKSYGEHLHTTLKLDFSLQMSNPFMPVKFLDR